MGYRTGDEDDVFSLAVHDVSRTFIRDLDALGYEHLPLEDLVSMRIHGAGPEFIRELKALGYDGLIGGRSRLDADPWRLAGIHRQP